MKRYSIVHVPVLSFFSKALYRDVALQWRGTGFGYLFLLLAVTWIPAMIGVHLSFSAFVTKEAPKLLSQMPNLTIRNGKASITEPMPYFIKDPNTREVVAIIDTTGTTTSLDGTTAKILVTQTEAICKKSEIETQTIKFRDIGDFQLNRGIVEGWLTTLHRILAPVLYVLAVGGSFVYRILQALIYAVIGLLFAAVCRVKLSYAALLRLAVAAVTPCIVVDTILGIAGVHLPYSGLWYFLVTMGYLFYGVSAVAQAEPATEGPTTPAGTTPFGENWGQ